MKIDRQTSITSFATMNYDSEGNTTYEIDFAPHEMGAHHTYRTIAALSPDYKGTATPDERMTTLVLRDFNMRCILTKTAHDIDKIFVGTEHDTIGSYISTDVKPLMIIFCGLQLNLLTNRIGEIAAISAVVGAYEPIVAHDRFLETVNSLVDVLALHYNIPIHVGKITLSDRLFEVTYSYFMTPPTPIVFNRMEYERYEILAPLYSLFRAAKNSDSPFYRLLCYHKVIEGTYSTIRGEVYKIYKNKGITVLIIKDILPNDPELPDYLRKYIGKSIKEFSDNYITHKFRDAVAHFTTKNADPVNLSDVEHIGMFNDAAYAAELCCREIIKNTERLLKAVQDAEIRD